MSLSAMSLDTVLNLVWLSIGASALAWLGLLECRRHRFTTRLARYQRLCAVLLVTATLFPAVSSSDDLFSFSLLNSQLGKHGGASPTLPEDPSGSKPAKDKAGLQLVRLLETLDHFQISGVYILALTLSCFAFVFALSHDVFTCAVLCRSGRAPPHS